MDQNGINYKVGDENASGGCVRSFEAVWCGRRKDIMIRSGKLLAYHRVLREIYDNDEMATWKEIFIN